MKNTLKYMLGALLFGAACTAHAECEINLAVMEAPQTDEVPEATLSYLSTRLTQIATAEGVTTDPGMGQFFLAGKFSHVLEDVVPGPPAQTALHTMLTLYIGDVNSQTVYATTVLDLRGVGNSSQRAFINALRGLSARNSAVSGFIRKGKQKVADYYDAHYPQIFERAKRAAAMHNYDEALWNLASIPECCRGYGQAMELVDRYFQQYINQEGTRLLAAADAAWSAHPDSDGAEKALSYLLAIDPESSAYPQAQRLADEIKKSVKSDRDFELRTKYNDAVDLERRRIQAAKEVGVAFGNGQKQKTTNLMWLK